MRHAKTTLPFKGTPEQHEQLLKAVKKHSDDPGALMPVMQEAQNIYGYLPIEVQTVIAEQLQIPVAEVYSTATFYSQFSLSPKGKYKVAVCMGTACYVQNAQLLVDRLVQLLGIHGGECTEDGMFSIDECRCIGACGLAPLITVNEDVHGRITADDIEGILAQYK